MHTGGWSRVISAAAPHPRPLPAGGPSARRSSTSGTTSRLEKAFSRREVVLQAVSRRADDSPAGGGRAWGAAAEITRLHSSLCTLEAAGARDAERDHEMPCSHHQTLPRSCRHFSEPFPYLFRLRKINSMITKKRPKAPSSGKRCELGLSRAASLQGPSEHGGGTHLQVPRDGGAVRSHSSPGVTNRYGCASEVHCAPLLIA